MLSQAVIALTFVVGVQSTTTTTTVNPLANKTVCYDHVGCFNNLPPFDNAAFDLPLSPNQIGTQFLLFTRRNKNNADTLDYVSQTSVHNSHYMSTQKTKFIIHGFANSVKTVWLYAMKDAFLTKGDFNIIIVAWGKGAVPPHYNQAVSNTRMVGTQTRLIIKKLVQAGGSLDDIHIIGHSLGAHTAGSAGRQLHGKVGRITGLDPAEPDFENHPAGVRLDPTDAKFVDIIHTNGAPIRRGGAGLMQVSGHVDFYVNGGKSQPGCPNLVAGAFQQLFNHNVSGAVLAASCSHGRAHEYFTESILTNCPFTAYPCESYEKFTAGGCMTCGSSGCSQLGLSAEKNTGRGKMYLNTQIKTTAPFCGYHYLIKTVYGTEDSIGQIMVTMHDATGHTQQIAITNPGAHLRAGMPHTQVVVLASRFTDITSIDVLYHKKIGFLFGRGGKSQITLTSVSVEEIQTRNRYTFCMRGINLPDGVSVSSMHLSSTSTSGDVTLSKNTTHDLMTTTPTSLNSTTHRPNPYANKTRCFPYVGCFDNFPPFDNTDLDLPRSPEQIGTEFLLFTRRNWNNSQHLNYTSLSSVTNSFYKGILKTKIIIHGFTNSIKTKWLYVMKDALLKKGDFNVIVVAWGRGATAPNYNQAASNTRMVGTQLRLIVDMLVRAGGKVSDMHLIGHSLGAHTAGYTGRLLHGRVGRITGMDPAEPDFEHLSAGIRLDPNDANFVDVIHTNGAPFSKLGYGLMQVSGHVDFFVNGGEKQTGCPNQIGGLFSTIFTFNTSAIGEAIACSHGRSHVYFTESILTDCPFTAYPCDNYENFTHGECMTCGARGCSELGYYADQYSARGKMYLMTVDRNHGPFCGFHYVIKYDLGTTDTYGTLSITLNGAFGSSHSIALTEKDAHLKTNGVSTKVVAVPSEVGEVMSVDVLYKKKKGGWFGWGAGADDINVLSVSVMSGELGISSSFCVRKLVHDGTSVRIPKQVAPVC
ncbi:uncharacterized protein LOC133184539 [Saccostrea echinata]|uniref:uncharacterized protein LOC133184539 n=1 Tax=Saccostrea echinata TaxID=191078 RepID=UPI002A7FE6BC|nr:uncharacterized protein LOC133184539 [Saccostrea echinata]